MNETSIALIGYIIWMIVMVLSIISYRGLVVMTGKKAPNDFSSAGNDVSPLMQRMCRVHANGSEHFPIFGGLLLLALILDMSTLTNPLAYYFLALRITQGIVHLLSKNIFAVFIRLGLFLAQCGIAIYWITLFLTHV